MRSIAWRPNTRNSFTARAVVRRKPELHHLHWRTDFAPTEVEPWNHYANWKFLFNDDQLESDSDFWLPLGRWRATANNAPISPLNAIELLGDGIPIAELTAPDQVVTFTTPWDTGGNNVRLTARLSSAPLATAEVSLFYEAQFDLNGQVPRFTQLDDLLLVAYEDPWSSPARGVITLQPVLYAGAGHILAEGPLLTLTPTGEDGGSAS